MGVIYLKNLNNDESVVPVSNLTETKAQGQFDQLSFEFYAGNQGDVASEMMIPFSIVEVPETGNKYRIQSVAVNPIGRDQSFNVTALSIGTELHDNFLDGRLNGTQSLDACMKFITKGTNFNYVIHDSFKNYSFSDGFGASFADDLLLNTLAGNFKFEWWLDNYTIHIAKKQGLSDAFAFVDGNNVAGIQRSEDFSGIATTIKGFGKPKDQPENSNKPVEYVTSVNYTSPKAGLWGIKSAATIYDERFTDKNALLEYVKSQLQDYPIVQYTVSQFTFNEHSPVENNIGIGNMGVLRDRFGTDVDVRIIGTVTHPQDSSIADTITFGNSKFNFVEDQARQKAANRKNLNIGKTMSNKIEGLNQQVTSGIWYESV